jgi:hypothetical protein
MSHDDMEVTKGKRRPLSIRTTIEKNSPFFGAKLLPVKNDFAIFPV